MSTHLWRQSGTWRRTGLAFAVAAAFAATAYAQTSGDTTFDSLREQVAERYDVVQLSRGIGLVPKSQSSTVRLVEITDEGVALDGQVVTGQELRTRLGSDADLVLRLTYLAAEDRQRLTVPAGQPAPASPAPPAPPTPPSSRRDRDSGDSGRVRIFRSVRVEPNETVDGDVVAVFGSTEVDGNVTGDVVAVMGSARLGPQARVGGDLVAVMGGVRLGPDSRVGGDVVAVGGEIERGPGSEIGGEINEVAMGPRVDLGNRRPAFWPFAPVYGFGRLFVTLVRGILLALIASLVLLVAQRPVSRMAQRVQAEPVKAGLVGLVAELLFVPLLVVTCVILAVSIIGIPLLLLVPFALVFLVFVILAGFSGVACVTGEWLTRRFGWTVRSPYVLVWLGVGALLTPLIAARLLGLAGGLFNMFATILAVVALLIEYVAWTAGFGAAILGPFSARRAATPTDPPTIDTSGARAAPPEGAA